MSGRLSMSGERREGAGACKKVWNRSKKQGVGAAVPLVERVRLSYKACESRVTRRFPARNVSRHSHS